MSERYGAEPRETLSGLEEWLREEIAEHMNTVAKGEEVHEVRQAAIQLIALGAVLDFILVNPGG